MMILLGLAAIAGTASQAVADSLRRVPLDLAIGLGNQDYVAWRAQQLRAYRSCFVRREADIPIRGDREGACSVEHAMRVVSVVSTG